MARDKKAFNFYINAALIERLEDWIRRQEFPPTKTAVLEMALSDFLDAREKKGPKK